MLRPLFESPRTRLRQGFGGLSPSVRQGFGGLVLLALAAGCRQDAPTDRVRVSGHVEADDVQLAAEVGGRVLELTIAEGDRVTAGQVIARLDTRDAELGDRTIARGPCPGRRAASAAAGRVAARRHPAGSRAGHGRRGRHRGRRVGTAQRPGRSRPVRGAAARPTRGRARRATTRRRRRDVARERVAAARQRARASRRGSRAS